MAYGSVNADLMTTSDGVSSSGLYGFKNRLINSAMVIDQRNAGAAVTTSTYCPDRWRVENSSDAAFSAQQVSDAPTGFVNSLKWTTTTADASLAATQYALVRQGIEGYNIADLMWGTASAATITISFWVKSTLTGTFGGVAGNGAFDRSYPFTYTISSANTWEYKTITIAGDTTGTWATTNAAGMQLYFGLGTGTTYSGTAGAWTGSGLISATGAVSVIGTLNATWQITGVQLEKGSTATSFDYRPYSAELQLCQRYFEVVSMNGLAGSSSTTAVGFGCSYKVQKRATPTVVNASTDVSLYSFYRPGLGSGNPSSVSITSDLGDSRNFNITLANFSGLTNNQAWVGRYEGLFNASAEL
jgi:hypothetical protein